MIVMIDLSAIKKITHVNGLNILYEKDHNDF